MQITATQPGAQTPPQIQGFRRPEPTPEQRQKFLDAASEALGMSAVDLKAELDSGKKLGTIAKEKGVSEQDLQKAIREAIAEPGGGAQRAGRHHRHHGGEIGDAVAGVIADKLGVSAEALESQLKGGASLRDIAAKAGISDSDMRSILEDAFSKLMPYGPNGTQAAPSLAGAASQVDELA